MTNKKISPDYSFSLKDLEGTTERHASWIKKVREAIRGGEVPISWYEFEGAIEDNIYNSNFYIYRLMRADSWLNKLTPKRRLRAIKSQVNDQTRQMIRRELEWNQKPLSWDTAFYLVNYKKINRVMARIAKYFFNYKFN